jgi:hypothetical protein
VTKNVFVTQVRKEMMEMFLVTTWYSEEVKDVSVTT